MAGAAPLIIAGAEIDQQLSSSRPGTWSGLKVLPSIGANVYDILHGETLVLTKSAVADLEERLA